MTAEHWQRVPGFDGYEVSDQGRVRSWRGRWGRTSPRPLSMFTHSTGYRRVCLYRTDGTREHVFVHYLVLLAFVGERPTLHEVRHLDGTRTNNSLENLAYGTRSENTLDAVRHGTHPESRKTHCPHGHPYDELNTRRRPNGKRACRACDAGARPRRGEVAA